MGVNTINNIQLADVGMLQKSKAKERHRERQRERQRDRQRDRQTERRTDRQTGREIVYGVPIQYSLWCSNKLCVK